LTASASLRCLGCAWLALAGACGGNVTTPDREIRVVRLDAPLSESEARGAFGGGQITHHALLERLQAMPDDPSVAGLMLEVGALQGAFARAHELASALAEIRKAKKPVHCHVEHTDNAGYALLARSCDRISITPSGMLDVAGISAEAMYARELLESLGIRAELFQVGRYKGAADPLTRNDMPAEVRETLSSLVDDLQGAMVEAISVGRSLPKERVQGAIDAAPLDAHDALRAGLVDDVGFDDEARAHLRKLAKTDRVVDEALDGGPPPKGLFELLRELTKEDDGEDASGPRVTLVQLEGTILRGTEGSFQAAHASAFVKKLRRLGDDEDVRAIVLRIDSPGGSAHASDLMWHAVHRAAKRKPVIVSIGDMAASGGYYVASAGTEIMAQDQSLVGSIGVVGGKVVIEALAERVGVRVERLSRGEHAGWASALRGFSEGERALFERSLQATYARFIDRIVRGRGMKAEAIAPYAEGRLMTAKRARKGGLIDLEGGLPEAIALARRRGKLASDSALEVWPKRPSLLQALEGFASGAEVDARGLGLLLQARTRLGLVETLLAGEGKAAAVLPYLLSLR
jgi:protease-4